jgi:hypothetical protein
VCGNSLRVVLVVWLIIALEENIVAMSFRTYNGINYYEFVFVTHP